MVKSKSLCIIKENNLVRERIYAVTDSDNRQITECVYIAKRGSCDWLSGDIDDDTCIKHAFIADKYTHIGHRAFSSIDLKSAELPDGLSFIDKEAFKYPDLEGIVIPDGIAAVHSTAFKGFGDLKSITWRGKIYNSIEAFNRAFSEAFADYYIAEKADERGAYRYTGLRKAVIHGGITKIEFFAERLRLKTAFFSRLPFPQALFSCGSGFGCRCRTLRSALSALRTARPARRKA